MFIIALLGGCYNFIIAHQLVIKGEYKFDLKTVWAKKKTLLKYGEAVFETSMQEWLNYGDTYFYSYENIIELIGTVFKPIHISLNQYI